ncbi:hypothetical protein [Embleya sp. NBC_00896]|uniref:hypothetical protein n=1 Tax=Embleya sp. NBC_00896 TaxID=2975961 RepID=UPI002F917D87|nr:hypothetical protein OG928_45675 [Embleya sp. NBC_00896]
MTAGWAPGAVRARTMLSRCVGPDELRRIAALSALDEAVQGLGSTAYGRRVGAADSLAEAQRAVADTLLWQLRVLAGWQTRSGADDVRLLASGFEISNTEAHIRSIRNGEGAPPYRLGALAIAWPRLAHTSSLPELRAQLARSPWGDPGADTAAAIGVGMRVAASVRVAEQVPLAAVWARKRLALLICRERFLLERELTDRTRRIASRLLGAAAPHARSFADYRRAVPTETRTVFAGIDRPAQLWRAEARWWTDVECEGRRLLRRRGLGQAAVVGAIALMSTDAWRTRAALAVATTGGVSPEVLDASF